MLVLVTGGARSGKSSFAERYAAHLGNAGIYIATAQIYDDEMHRRVEQHQIQREQSGYPWETIAEPYQLRELLSNIGTNIKTTKSGKSEKVVMIDCLTLWLSNWLLKYESDLESTNSEGKSLEGLVNQQIEDFIDSIKSFEGTLIMVTNEVGSGIVPEYPLGRQYRDLAGTMNRKIAEVCDQVFMVISGIPLELKSNAFHF